MQNTDQTENMPKKCKYIYYIKALFTREFILIKLCPYYSTIIVRGDILDMVLNDSVGHGSE